MGVKPHINALSYTHHRDSDMSTILNNGVRTRTEFHQLPSLMFFELLSYPITDYESGKVVVTFYDLQSCFNLCMNPRSINPFPMHMNLNLMINPNEESSVESLMSELAILCGKESNSPIRIMKVRKNKVVKLFFPFHRGSSLTYIDANTDFLFW